MKPVSSPSNRKEEQPTTLSSLLSSPEKDQLAFLGGIYEKSPWVAEKFLSQDLKNGDMTTIKQLFMSMKSIVDATTHDQKTELLHAHPNLATRASSVKNLTIHSQEEQSHAGLQNLTLQEYDRFMTLNRTYREKFGFPFILAVRNATKNTVLSSIEGRISNSREVEISNGMKQVHKIAWMRLLAQIHVENPTGFLTLHVLDTTHGSPGANMRIHLHRLSPPEDAGFIAEFITNDDGRISSPGGILKGSDFKIGTYQLTFFVGDYFARKSVDTSGIPFLSEVPIVFGIDDPDEHYHVPLLVSPFSYSTYRGS